MVLYLILITLNNLRRSSFVGFRGLRPDSLMTSGTDEMPIRCTASNIEAFLFFKVYQTIDGCDMARFPLLFCIVVRKIMMSILGIVVFQTNSQKVLRSCLDGSPQRRSGIFDIFGSYQ